MRDHTPNDATIFEACACTRLKELALFTHDAAARDF
jgi:hypothetical protein